MDFKTDIKKHFDSLADSRDKWRKKNKYYHASLVKLFSFLIPEGKRILEIGCGTGDLLTNIKAKEIVGIDISPRMIAAARRRYPAGKFFEMDAEDIQLTEKFDYIVAADLISFLDDIEKAFKGWHKVCNSDTRLIITHYNFLWEPLVKLSEILHLKMPERPHNWLTVQDTMSLLHLADFEVIKTGSILIFPKYFPLLSSFLNKYVARLPFFRRLALVNYIVARPAVRQKSDYSVSVVVAAKNEKGNIEALVKRLPGLGTRTEIIFVGGKSHDGTNEEIEKIIMAYPEKNLRFFLQKGQGKADAVRLGFDNATGDILMILDADLSVAPEDLTKFYNAIADGKGEFINGSRLVYAPEDQSMRSLNLIGNKFFSLMFSWILDDRIKDTLCGTKVLFKKDYENIKVSRAYFGDFDPFGDFDLLFGASKLNLKIAELPVRYHARTYGKTNISRWRHGWLLLKMTLFAMNKIKFF